MAIDFDWQGGRFSFRLDAQYAAMDFPLLDQVHGKRILDRDRDNSDFCAADGSFTRQTERWVAVRTADCLPVLILIPGLAAAALHAGWRGVDEQIQVELYRQWQREGLPVANAVWVIGPHICASCFAVTEPVLSQFSRPGRSHSVVCHATGHTTVSLYACLLADLHAVGFPVPQQVLSVGGCTFESTVWPSYRRDGAEASRIYAAVQLNQTTDSRSAVANSTKIR